MPATFPHLTQKYNKHKAAAAAASTSAIATKVSNAPLWLFKSYLSWVVAILTSNGDYHPSKPIVVDFVFYDISVHWTTTQLLLLLLLPAIATITVACKPIFDSSCCWVNNENINNCCCCSRVAKEFCDEF